MAAPRISTFTNERARARFASLYDRLFAKLWPADHISVDVPTSWGTTRVYRSGAATGLPLVLLPGAGGNALMWHGYVARLGATHPVIAVDPVGEPGASTQDRPLPDGREAAAWLEALLDGLALDRVHLVGCSYGGWVALQHALHTAPPHSVGASGRVVGMTLVEPGGFGDPGVRFIAWAIAGGLAGLGPRWFRRRAARWLTNATLLDDDVMSLAVAVAGFRRRMPLAGTIADADLGAITTPTLALFGARSPLHDSTKAAARVASLMPSGRSEVVDGTGHDLVMSHPDRVADRVLAFAGRGHRGR